MRVDAPRPGAERHHRPARPDAGGGHGQPRAGRHGRRRAAGAQPRGQRGPRRGWPRGGSARRRRTCWWRTAPGSACSSPAGVPIRRAGDGSRPVDGADGAHDWIGFASGGAPAACRGAGPSGSSGRMPTIVSQGRTFQSSWVATFLRRLARSRRIHALLDGRTPAGTLCHEFGAMQADPVTSVFAGDAAPLPACALSRPLAGPRRTGVRRMLATWNGTMDRGRSAGTADLQRDGWRRTSSAGVAGRRTSVPLEARDSADPWSETVDVTALLTPDGRGWCGGDCAPILSQMR